MLKQRGIKAVIISLLVLLSSTCFSLICINAYTSFANQEVNAPIAFSGGRGTASSPYLISSISDLQTLAAYVNDGYSYNGEYFKLKNDIDFSSGNFSGIGSGSESSGKFFAGKFNGDGWCIKNVKITGTYSYSKYSSLGDKTNYYYYTGFFINLSSSASITNLKIENCTSGVTKKTGGRTETHYYYFDSLVCNYNGSGTINRCYVIGTSDGNITNSLILDGSTASVSNSNVYGSSTSSTCPDLSGLGTSVSSVGGTSGTSWYRAEGYHGGWPIPRVFIKNWNTKKYIQIV